MSPAQLEAAWEAGAAAIVPWGALEWHGDHLPLGLDGIVAESFAERLADQMEGVLLPGIWLPITTLPHPASLQIRTETFRAVLDDTLLGLAGAGVRSIAVVTGHYAQGHLIELYEAALRAMDDCPGLRVFAATPLQPLNDPSLLDHAARYETSQLLAIRPDLVHVEDLPDETEVRRDAVLGEHPRLGSAAEGHALLQKGLEAWATWIQTATRDSLEQFYKAEFDALQAYVDAYYTGSWDEALEAWWATKDRRSPAT
ncbi:creatinine amidohydrolase [Fimbriimonas ginsengisoli Gsoil 348]|uniref:Creatinine amidohydrolase n=2 Tax=Fimbriimonas ginsengisoli TaxID=1005039 RepID=A0A068NLP2_FIMGI|nr:creatinine amidohydrolase [Fimbriimonas ginsengisoli Gsoil 348]